MSPSRSTKVTIENHTGSDLVLGDNGLDHGEWTQSMSPPSLIRNGENGVFQAESAGFMTGDQGHVDYSNSAGRFTFNFDNPFSGSNGYDQSVPNGFVASHDGGGGDNAEVTWKVEKVN
ncbi:hypothetical protein ACHAQD_012093 [Fusarium lateritium]